MTAQYGLTPRLYRLRSICKSQLECALGLAVQDCNRLRSICKSQPIMSTGSDKVNCNRLRSICKSQLRQHFQDEKTNCNRLRSICKSQLGESSPFKQHNCNRLRSICKSQLPTHGCRHPHYLIFPELADTKLRMIILTAGGVQMVKKRNKYTAEFKQEAVDW